MTPRTRIQLFRAVAATEALSWAGLLVGMYAKYLTDAGEPVRTAHRSNARVVNGGTAAASPTNVTRSDQRWVHATMSVSTT